MASRTLLQAIAVTAEITGTELSKEAARVFASDLDEYPEPQVLAALTRVRRECKGRMTVADVIQRIDDGRPSADEAWAMIPTDERASCVWTQEMASAYGVCCKLMGGRDSNAARMAFRSAYENEVKRAREAKVKVTWYPSLGTDVEARAGALEEAVRKGRLSAALAVRLSPNLQMSPEIAKLVAPVAAQLTVKH